jgi:hypothetical protein
MFHKVNKRIIVCESTIDQSKFILAYKNKFKAKFVVMTAVADDLDNVEVS